MEHVRIIGDGVRTVHDLPELPGHQLPVDLAFVEVRPAEFERW